MHVQRRGRHGERLGIEGVAGRPDVVQLERGRERIAGHRDLVRGSVQHEPFVEDLDARRDSAVVRRDALRQFQDGTRGDRGVRLRVGLLSGEGTAGLVPECRVVFDTESAFIHADITREGAVALEPEPLRTVLDNAARNRRRRDRDCEPGAARAARRVFVHHEFGNRAGAGPEREVLAARSEDVARVENLRGGRARVPRGVVNGESILGIERRQEEIPVDRVRGAGGAGVDPVDLFAGAAVAEEGLRVDRIEGRTGHGEFAGEPGKGRFHADACGGEQFDVAGPGVIAADVHQRTLGADERIGMARPAAADGQVLVDGERGANIGCQKVERGAGENVDLGLNRVALSGDPHAKGVVILDRDPTLFDLRHAGVSVRTRKDEVPGSSLHEIGRRATRDGAQNGEAVIVGQVVRGRARVAGALILIDADGGIRGPVQRDVDQHGVDAAAAAECTGVLIAATIDLDLVVEHQLVGIDGDGVFPEIAAKRVAGGLIVAEARGGGRSLDLEFERSAVDHVDAARSQSLGVANVQDAFENARVATVGVDVVQDHAAGFDLLEQEARSTSHDAADNQVGVVGRPRGDVGHAGCRTTQLHRAGPGVVASRVVDRSQTEPADPHQAVAVDDEILIENREPAAGRTRDSKLTRLGIRLVDHGTGGHRAVGGAEGIRVGRRQDPVGNRGRSAIRVRTAELHFAEVFFRHVAAAARVADHAGDIDAGADRGTERGVAVEDHLAGPGVVSGEAAQGTEVGGAGAVQTEWLVDIAGHIADFERGVGPDRGFADRVAERLRIGDAEDAAAVIDRNRPDEITVVVGEDEDADAVLGENGAGVARDTSAQGEVGSAANGEELLGASHGTEPDIEGDDVVLAGSRDAAGGRGRSERDRPTGDQIVVIGDRDRVEGAVVDVVVRRVGRR